MLKKFGVYFFIDMMGKNNMPDYWLPWLVGMPAETSLAICSMIFGGVFEKLPKLRVAFAHGGGLNSQGCHNNRKTGDYHCHSKGESKNNNENQIMKFEVAPPVNQPRRQIVIINSCYDGDTCTSTTKEFMQTQAERDFLSTPWSR